MCEYRVIFENTIRSNADKQWGSKKQKLIDKYGWFVPNKSCVSSLAESDSVLEIGSGKGYLASVVNSNNGNIYATDIDPPENSWVEVDEMSLDDIVDSPDSVPTTDTILTTWPPADSTLDAEIVMNLDPSVLYYIGVLDSNITGSKQFSSTLSEYKRVQKIEVNGWIKDECLHKFIKE